MRHKRESLTPEVIGLSRSKRSRTPGLRREDVAEIAGISVVWYSKIERGKAAGISYEAMDSLSQALRLTPPEKQYLQALSNQSQKPIKKACQNITTETRRMLTQMNPLPALLINDHFDIIECNQSFRRMCGVEINSLPEESKNYIYLTITHPTWQRFITADHKFDLEDRLSHLTGILRTTSALCSQDQKLKNRIEHFQKISPSFERYWQCNSIEQCEQRQFTFFHAELGNMTFNKQMWWNYGGGRSGRLNVYHPVNEEDYQRLY